MGTRIFITLVLCAAVRGWGQDAGTPQDEQPDNPVANAGALTPPPVNGQAYPAVTGAEARTNYLSLGLTGSVAYDDNVAAGYATNAQTDMIYSLYPTISLNRNTARVQENVNYSPGFTFYHPSNFLNESDQNLAAGLKYFFNEHTSINLQDNFLRSSSLFGQPFGNLGNISGGLEPGAATAGVAAFANRISNAATAELSKQVSEYGVAGLTAEYGQLSYPNPSQTAGLYNSASYIGSAFVSQRISARQFLGGTIQHARIVSYLKSTDNSTQTDNLFGFYTIYFRQSQISTVSLSVTGGPEHYSIQQAPEAIVRAWSPAVTVAFGAQTHLTNVVATYTHHVTAGGGLPGAYREDSVRGSYRRQLTPTWFLNLQGLWVLSNNLTPQFPLAEPGGHIASGKFSVEHSINQRLRCEAGYMRMNESYIGIGQFSKFPNSNYEYGAITWQFTRPMGR
jgi:hypothetical protein